MSQLDPATSPSTPNLNAQPPYHQPRHSGVSISSMIVGIVSVVLFCLFPITLLGNLAAVITGHIGMSQIKKSNGMLSGKGMAITGLILGYLGLIVPVAFVSLAFIFPGDSGAHNLAEAQEKVESLQAGATGGPAADEQKLAQGFLDNLLSRNGDTISFEKTELKVWCEEHNEHLSFLVVDLRSNKNEENEAMLAKRFWASALHVIEAAGATQQGTQVAVAIHDSSSTLEYFVMGEFQSGQEDPSDSISEIDRNNLNETNLYPFFRELDPEE